MKKNKQIQNNVVIFSQWSRKSYAVFATLKRVISIAHLSIDLCHSALLKGIFAVLFVKLSSFDDDEVIELELNEIIENPIHIAATLPVVCSSNSTYPQNKINNYILRKPIFCPAQSMGFLFFNTTL